MLQYSFSNVTLSLEVDWGNAGDNPNDSLFDITGYPAGENLINAQRRAPIASTQFSAFGQMILNMNRIEAGDLAFPLLQNAPENKALQEWCDYFQETASAGGRLIKPIQGFMHDKMGNDKCKMINGVILAMPSMTRGQTVSVDNWVISFEKMLFKRELGGDWESLGV